MKEAVAHTVVVLIIVEDTNKYMRLKNVLIVVKNIELSKRFYKDLFDLEVMTDFGKNVVLTEGLVLQEQTVWEEFVGQKVVPGGNAMELYFEHHDLKEFAKKLETSSYNIQYVNPLTEYEWGQKAIRFYDPDMHLIEVGEI